jgi:hypothetical protein
MRVYQQVLDLGGAAPGAARACARLHRRRSLLAPVGPRAAESRSPRGARGLLAALTPRAPRSSREARSPRPSWALAMTSTGRKRRPGGCPLRAAAAGGLDNEWTIGVEMLPGHGSGALPGTRKAPANRGLFGERLKGFEPSTFCMASRSYGCPSAPISPANARVLRCGCHFAIPRRSTRVHGGWAPNGHPGRLASGCRRPLGSPSAKTIIGALPLSSRFIRFTVAAPLAAMIRPTAVLPL